MKPTKVFVSGRYISQIESIKESINRTSNLNWILTELPNQADLLLFFDYTDLVLEKSSGIKILIRQEPKLVLPINYKKRKIRKFDKIIDVGKAGGSSAIVINWPQKLVLPINNFANRVSTRVIMINSNLINLGKDELYSLRRAIAFKNNKVDLYGYGWNSSTISRIKTIMIEIKKFVKQPYLISFKSLKYYFVNQSNYLGPVSDKISAMSNYRISLVIENSPSFVSEKLFDALSGGCIPVYVGPDLVNFEIPKNLYIQAEPSLNKVLEAIGRAQKMDYVEWFGSLERWMKSEECYLKWSEKTFIYRLKELVGS
jgi:hypothetical protein